MKNLFFRSLFAVSIAAGALIAEPVFSAEKKEENTESQETKKAKNDPASIRKRMETRKAAIRAMKTPGLIGENNLGYLAKVDEKKKLNDDQQKVFNEENADRHLVYAAIAKKDGANAEAVGKRRAKKIAEKIAEKGDYIQDEKGAWIQKKD